MLDLEENGDPSQQGMGRNGDSNSKIKYFSFLIYIITFFVYRDSLFSCDNLSLNDCVKKYNLTEFMHCFIKCIVSGFILSVNIAFIVWKFIDILKKCLI